jgi:hypothetical protein
MVNLERVQGLHPAELRVVAPPVPDDDPAGGGVDPGGEGRGRGDDLDQPIAEGVLDEISVLTGESSMVERGAPFHGVSEVVARRGVGHVPERRRELPEGGALLVGEVALGHLGQSRRRGLGVAPRVDEDEA